MNVYTIIHVRRTPVQRSCPAYMYDSVNSHRTCTAYMYAYMYDSVNTALHNRHSTSDLF